jgi:hypothetical protein
MKINCLLCLVLLKTVFGGLAFSQSPIAEQQYLSLTPDLTKATMQDGRVKIPFNATNDSTEDIALALFWDRIDGLMTLDDSGGKVFIEALRTGVRTGGGPVHRVVLKPGESKTYECDYSLKTLDFIVNKNKKVFGAITGRVARTNQLFQSYSAPFSIPPQLLQTPWVDLGEQKYFSVTPDLTQARIEEGWLEGGAMVIPVKIANVSGPSCILSEHSVGFELVRVSAGKAPPPWETFKASGPVLKPGDATSWSSYISLQYLDLSDYKQGEKLVAVVAGRISGTNKVFECYSTPFELPPLKKSQERK